MVLGSREDTRMVMACILAFKEHDRRFLEVTTLSVLHFLLWLHVYRVHIHKLMRVEF